ncbi:MAG: carbon storage regulator CsrA [Isosphaeraceae bacterium]
MLVLSRKIGDSIQIGNNITLTVVKVDRNQVRLGITAPRDVQILRDELKDHPKKVESFIDIDMDQLTGCR